jgi:hypothetical protein
MRPDVPSPSLRDLAVAGRWLALRRRHLAIRDVRTHQQGGAAPPAASPRGHPVAVDPMWMCFRPRTYCAPRRRSKLCTAAVVQRVRPVRGVKLAWPRQFVPRCCCRRRSARRGSEIESGLRRAERASHADSRSKVIRWPHPHRLQMAAQASPTLASALGVTAGPRSGVTYSSAIRCTSLVTDGWPKSNSCGGR